MPFSIGRRLGALVISAAALAAAPAAPAQAACDHYAAPAGSDTAAGTAGAPLRTAQRLADALEPGETGCLRGGEYDQEVSGPYVLRLGHGGTAGAPITIRSAPGERARLRGIVYFPKGSDHVTLADLHIDGRRPRATAPPPVSIQVMAADVRFERLDITNQRTRTCMILGSTGSWGAATRTVVRESVFHDCGDARNTMRDHAIYLERAADAEIVDNVFVRTSGFAIHFYPKAERARVAHNVMYRNGGGVIFAGYDAMGSSHNVVEHNVISDSTDRADVSSWWGGVVGTGNVVRSNCLRNTENGELDGGKGYVARENRVAAPRYVDPGAGDLRLAAGSECLQAVGYDTVAKLRGAPAAPVAAVRRTAAPKRSACRGRAARLRTAPARRAAVARCRRAAARRRA